MVVAFDATGQTIATGRPGGRGRWSCHYYGIDTDGSSGQLPGSPQLDEGPIWPTDGQYVYLECWASSGGIAFSDELIWDPAAPFGPIDAGIRAAQVAREQLPLPDPIPAGSPPLGAAHITGIPTWFWTGTPWQPISASATLGGVTATVTATPTQLVVDPGDGTEPFACPGGGTAYDPARPADAQQSTCTHAYRFTSRDQPGGVWPATLTITWHITWTATTGEAGDLGDESRTTAIPLRVTQAQALIL